MFLNESVMVSKKPWLEEVLRSGQMEVLIYNGNLVRWKTNQYSHKIYGIFHDKFALLLP